ncbi:unnamed protein product [Didymodactylos carnosus]|uniref:Fringe-like glycosyltransferase domain-containing protein n=1 Tax=Didymodactylos carnosus TaxID=1234261 RepID=A0A813ND93_9BILA|nr:unnamed protein product [Didymodactylos carnosus]CAF1150690.1 unnamed protein product [Didymodactylos carnosus]CAF3514907.1 unnamed protein product [Didymodactylos carnosus]CAF3957148.1 unnamed protein product [Didymodactylos carnosus]
MYTVRTVLHFYHTRLRYLTETWIPLVSEHVYFVTDSLPSNITTIKADHVQFTKYCSIQSHSLSSLCCKTAHHFLLYHRFKHKYEWFCHFDDDNYVNSKNLKNYLSKLDSSIPYYIGRNSWNTTLYRNKNPFPIPFWFATLGAGICLSSKLLHLLKPYTTNVGHFIRGCIRENYFDDIYLGFIINNFLNVTLTKNEQFHSHLEKTLFDNKENFIMNLANQITLGFRYPDRIPLFLPLVFSDDPWRIRLIHCLLFPNSNECQVKKIRYLIKSFNMTEK